MFSLPARVKLNNRAVTPHLKNYLNEHFIATLLLSTN